MMKHSLQIWCCTLLMIVAASPMAAQGKSDQKKEKPAQAEEAKKDNAMRGDQEDDIYRSDDADYNSDDVDKQGKKVKNVPPGQLKNKQNQGNAYGNNKQGLEGKEFGQERARQARLQNEKRRNALYETVTLAEQRLRTARQKLLDARSRLTEEKNTVTVEVFNERYSRIQRAMDLINDMEVQIRLARRYE